MLSRTFPGQLWVGSLARPELFGEREAALEIWSGRGFPWLRRSVPVRARLKVRSLIDDVSLTGSAELSLWGLNRVQLASGDARYRLVLQLESGLADPAWLRRTLGGSLFDGGRDLGRLELRVDSRSRIADWLQSNVDGAG